MGACCDGVNFQIQSTSTPFNGANGDRQSGAVTSSPTGFIPVEINVEGKGLTPIFLNFLHHRDKPGGIARKIVSPLHHLGRPSAGAWIVCPLFTPETSGCSGDRMQGCLIDADTDTKCVVFDQLVEQHFGVVRCDQPLLHGFQQDAQRSNGPDSF